MNVAIEMGLNCRYFEIDHYLNWGTPNDLGHSNTGSPASTNGRPTLIAWKRTDA